MPKPRKHLGITQEALERLLCEEDWLTKRPEWQDDKAERQLQLLLGKGTSSEDPIAVIRQFVALVDKGITPPAHVLAAICKGFREYVGSAGSKTLDDSFGFVGVQGKKHPLKQRLKDEGRTNVYLFMWCSIKKDARQGKKRKIFSVADDAVMHFHLNVTPRSLESEYKAAKYERRIFDNAWDALEAIHKNRQ